MEPAMKPDSTPDRLRRYWLKLFSSLLAELGYSDQPGADNWYIIENALLSQAQRTLPPQTQATLSMSPTAVSQESITRSNSGVLAMSANVPPPMSENMPAPVSPLTTVTSNSVVESSEALESSQTIETLGSGSLVGSKARSRSKSKSSLGTPITETQQDDALCLYSKMEDSKKWQLKSDRFVEDVMLNLVRTLTYEHPAMYGILDLADANWCKWFLPDEMLELKECVEVEIEYPPLPQDMQEYLRNIPNSSDLRRIYDHLEAQQVSLATQPSLAWLKISLQSVIYLFEGDYFPLSDQNERDLCGNVWALIGRAFVPSVLKCRTEKASIASKESNNKKRKMAADDCMERQQNALIPDMVIGYDSQEYAIIEAAKENNTKQIVEGGKKCPEMMGLMYDRLVPVCPAEHRSIKIYGCLLSRLKCTPLELSNPNGYVKLMRRGAAIDHPEERLTFKPKMVVLLAHIWRFKLAIESVLQVVIQGQYKHTALCGNMEE